MTALTFLVPVETVSETNQREVWSARHRRRRAQRHAVELCFRAAGGLRFARRHAAVGTRFTVALTRLCPPKNQLRDRDNLYSSLKAARDEVARLLGVDDSDLKADPVITWSYGQEKAPHYWVRVEIEVKAC